MELVSAVTAFGAEDVSGEAFGMDPAQDRFTVGHIAHDQGHVLFSVDGVAVTEDLEVAVGRRQVCVRFLDDEALVVQPVLDEVRDGDGGDAVLLRELEQLGGPHHGAVVPHDLAAEASVFEAGDAHEVDRRFRVAGADQHAAVFGSQGEHVSRPAEFAGLHALFHCLQRGDGPFDSGDARGGAHVVDGDRECRLVVVRVGGDHLGEPQVVTALAAHGHADEALRVDRHEVDVLGGRELGGADEVALVLPVRVIHTEDEFSRLQVLDRLFDGRKFSCHFVSFFP